MTGVHHTGKDAKTFRGSSAFEAGADTVYSTTDDGGTVTLAREKRKDGPPDDLHTLQLQLIGESGVMNAHRVEVNRAEQADLLLALFVEHFAATGASRAEVRTVAEAAGMPTATVYRVLNELVRIGDLVNAGTDKRPLYRVCQT